jgi:YYY domain-containing protein
VTAVLRWYVVVQVLGALALPLAFTLFRRLPDRGYFQAKALGVLGQGLLLWLGVSYGLVRNDVGGALLATAALAALAWAWGRDAFRPRPGEPSLWRWLREHALMALAAEVLFLAAFAAWAFVRAHDAAADHTERPMDLLFLGGIHGSPTYPPRDPWLSGHAISYYYLGYWLLNALALLSGEPPEVAFNVGQACWLGLLLLGSCGVGYDLLRLDGARPSLALGAGLLSAAAVGLSGNPQGTLDVLQREGLDLRALAGERTLRNFTPPDDHWWWWRASRVLQDRDAGGAPVEVIDEFPAFSYVVGDAHPHLLAMPFVLLAVGLALALSLAAREERVFPAGRVADALAVLVPWGVRGVAVLAIVVGSLVPLNTWDFPAAAFLVLLAALAGTRGAGWSPRLRTEVIVALGAALAALPALVFLPYFLTAQSQVQGLQPNLLHPTPLAHLLLMFAPLLLAVVVLLAVGPGGDVSHARHVWRDLGIGVAGGLVVLAALAALASPEARRQWLETPFTLILLASLLAAAVGQALRAQGAARRFALLLAVVGLLLALGPELAWLRDSFGTRMNTVFKLYSQAWILLGLAGAHGLAAAYRTGGAPRLASAVAGALLLSGLLYTGAAVHSVAGGFRSPSPTLDALAYLATAAPEEREAIDWVRRHTAAGDLVLQGVGASYQAADGRISVATGRPTLLGWEGHELQWRGAAFGAMAAGRADAARAIYQAADRTLLEGVLQAWDVRYVYVGPAERERYGVDAAAEQRLGEVMDLVFSRGSVRLYRRRGAAA